MPKLSAAGKKALDDLVAETIQSGRLPGFVLAVSNVDEQIYANAGGNKTYGDANSPPVTPDSLFWICSMTKLLVGLAALQLIEQGKLSFDTPVADIFPEFKDPVVLKDYYTNPNPTYEPAKEAITVLHLLTHSSGLYYKMGGAPDSLPSSYTHDFTKENKYSEFFELLKGEYPGIPLVFEPGTGFSYGYSSDVLGFIVEKVSGQSLEAYSKKNIFEPIGVKSTTYHLTAEGKDRLVDLCFRNEDDSISAWEERSPLIQRYPGPVNAYLGGVGCYSTLPDYLAILRHLLQIEAGCDVPNAILTRDTVKSLFAPKLGPAGSFALSFLIQAVVKMTFNQPNWSTALAITTTELEGRRKPGSGFWSGWAGTYYFLDPASGIALVFGSQVVPPMDPLATEISDKAERIVYAHLED
ncbi:beta-lactamase [Coprinopsis marcescibilis]|uniref:Beta-lactamase n=1 Tax=Coprinopsis marcescibilis TaxID=230819 RepID=A0A5C3L6C1_COPMA|nr:beta-lactamase [Coprinopsis marcescibilis]